MTSSGGNREELDSMVVEIDLTLCSIIQGVALYFLVDIHARPEFFLRHNGHLILIALQAIGLLFYLAHVIRAFIQFVPLISATREEWRVAAENAQRSG